jgi:hypothetical protein
MLLTRERKETIRIGRMARRIQGENYVTKAMAAVGPARNVSAQRLRYLRALLLEMLPAATALPILLSRGQSNVRLPRRLSCAATAGIPALLRGGS